MSFSFNRDDDHTIGMSCNATDGWYLVFYNMDTFMLDQCSCCPGVLLPPYLSGLYLWPSGGMTEDDIDTIFTNPQMEPTIVSYSAWGLNSSSDFYNSTKSTYKKLAPSYYQSSNLTGFFTAGTGLNTVPSSNQAKCSNYSSANTPSTPVSNQNKQYWNIILNGNGTTSFNLKSIVCNIYRSKQGPQKLSVQFLSNDTVMADDSNSLSFDISSSQQWGIGFDPPKTIENYSGKLEIRFIPYSAGGSGSTFSFNSSSAGSNALTLFGTVNNRQRDVPTGNIKAIHHQDWKNPGGMYVAKELYRYDFANNTRLDLVETETNNCRIKGYYDKLEFDVDNNLGYELAILPMAWDPGFQKYRLDSLILSLFTSCYFYDQGGNVSRRTYFNYNPFKTEIYDNLETHTSANFSMNKSDCYTTSAYKDATLEEYVSCNFSYFLSANYDTLKIFRS